MSTAQLSSALPSEKEPGPTALGGGMARQEPEAKKRDTWLRHTLAT